MYQNQYDNSNHFGYTAPMSPKELQQTVGQTMKRVYFKMTLGLLVTAFVSLFCASSASYLTFLASHTWFLFVAVLVEFGLVIAINSGIGKLSNVAASSLFYLFSAVNGLTLCTIFLAYDPTAITKTFFITAGTFGAMSAYGYLTNRDLSRIGSLLSMALIGLVIAMVVNFFLKSAAFDYIISIIGIFLFVGLTAWDTQQIKQLAQQMPGAELGRLATLGALNLYLDFINLFLFLLRIFGNRN